MTKEKAEKNSFIATREHHSLEAAEDYTELIYDLIEEQGEARTVAIAKRLGISHVTAIKTLRRLQDAGYIITANRKPVTLTKKGLRLAKFARKRHELLLELFLFLGIPRQVAEIDVEGAEHHLSKRSLKQIEKFLKEQKLR